MSEERVRLDKWLWAARFFRNRALAQQAIEGGKVHFDGARVKAHKEVRIGAVLRIRQGFDEKTVIVEALSSRRGGAGVAARLYAETPASFAAREAARELRKLRNANVAAGGVPPDKRGRRLIRRFKEGAWEP